MALKKDTWEMIRTSKLDDKKMFFRRSVYNLIFEPAQVESNKASGALEMGQGIKESTFEKLFCAQYFEMSGNFGKSLMHANSRPNFKRIKVFFKIRPPKQQ